MHRHDKGADMSTNKNGAPAASAVESPKKQLSRPGKQHHSTPSRGKSKFPLFDLISPPPPRLTPRHQRIIDALTATPKSILSYDLRAIARCQNIADEVQQLRKLGFKIVVEMEPFVTVDGVKSRIGRYRLADQEGIQI